MFIYDILAITLISISHVYLYIQLIQYERLSWKLLTTLSIVFTILLLIVITVTGYPELNMLILIFLLSLGLLQQKRGLTFVQSLYYALFSLVSITIVRMLLIKIIFELYMLSPFNLYIWTESIIHFITAMIIFISLIIWRKKISKVTRFIVEHSLYYVTYLLLVIAMFILLILTMPRTNVLNQINATYGEISYILLIVLFLLLLIIFVVSSHLAKEKLLEEQQEQLDNELLDYVEKLEVMHDELSSFRHDYRNVLLSLDNAIQTKNMSQIEQVYREVIAPTSEVIDDQQLELIKLSHISIHEVKSVIRVKVIEAQQRGLTVLLDIPEIINEIAMPVVSFIRALSIVLDNAIEEAEKSKHRRIEIAFFEIDCTQFFIVRNSRTDHPLHLPSIYEKNYSPNGKRRGYGLFSLKRLIDQIPHAMLETIYDDSSFSQKITLKKQ